MIMSILLQRLTVDIGPDAAKVALQAIEEEGFKVKPKRPKTKWRDCNLSGAELYGGM